MVNNRNKQVSRTSFSIKLVSIILILFFVTGGVLRLIGHRQQLKDAQEQNSTTAQASDTIPVCNDLPPGQQLPNLCDEQYTNSNMIEQVDIVPQITAPNPYDLNSPTGNNAQSSSPAITAPNNELPNFGVAATQTKHPFLITINVLLLLISVVWISMYALRTLLLKRQLSLIQWSINQKTFINVHALVALNICFLLFIAYINRPPQSVVPNVPPNVYLPEDMPLATPVPSEQDLSEFAQYAHNIISPENLILSPDYAVDMPAINGTTATIGLAGGVIEDDTGILRLEFDEGAVEQDIIVTIRPISFPQNTILPIDHELVFAPFEVVAEDAVTGEAITAFEPEIIIYNEIIEDDLGSRTVDISDAVPSVRLIIRPFEDPNAYLDPTSEAARHNYLYYLDEDNLDWVSMMSPYDVEIGAYVTETDHFTRFAFLNNSQAVEPSLVILDPAHGGADTGGRTTSPATYFAYEKNFNLDIARRTANRLRTCGVEVRLTRENDTTISVQQRADAINWYRPDASMTVAVNVVTEQMSFNTGSGTEIWRISNPANNALAGLIMSGIATATDLPQRSIWGGYASYIQDDLINASIPALHVEMAFMDHYRDRTILDAQPQIFADGMYNGMRNFLIGLGIDPNDCPEIPPSPLRNIFSRLFGVPPWSPEHPANFAGDPVNMQTGGFFYQQQDLYIPAPGMDMLIERSYNHQDTFNGGSLGLGWSTSLDTFIYVNENDEIDWRSRDGRVVIFSQVTNGSYEPQPGSFERLFTAGNGSQWGANTDEYVIVQADDTRLFYRLFGNSIVGQLVRVERSNGARFTYRYTPQGALSSIEDSAGRVYPVTVDAKGLITSITVPSGDSIIYLYSDAGLLLEVNGLDSRTIVYTYDEDNRLETVTDPNGQLILTNFYDDFNRVDYQLDANQNRIDFQYQPNARTSRIIDANGQVTVIRYDVMLRPIERITSVGITTYTYDDDWNLTETTRGDGSAIQREFDNRGNMLVKILPNGQRYEYTYDENGYAQSQTDPLGAITQFHYDSENNLTEIIEPDGVTTRMSYNNFGQVLTTTYPDDAIETYTYNSYGQVESIINPLGQTTYFTHNNMGHLIAVEDALGRITDFTTNNNGDVLSKILPNSGEYTYTYDNNGNMLSETDPLGAITTYNYTAFNQVASVTNSLGHTTYYSYNAVSDLIEIEDALGRITRYFYNSDGYLLVSIDALSQITRYERDALGRLLSVQDSAGHTSYNIFDESGRLIEEIDELGYSTTREYNLRDQVVQIIDRRGYNIVMNYDPLSGNLLRRTEPEGVAYNFIYDERDRIIQIIQPDDSSIRTDYDAIGRVIAQYDALGEVETYVFDAVGNLAEEVDRNGNRTIMTYNLLDNPLTITYATGATESFVYDLKGQSISYINANSHTMRYIRDLEGQITTEIDALGFETQYTYDAVGNQSTVTNPLGGVETYEYDELNRIITYRNPLDHTTTFSYSPLNELTSETDPNGHTIRYLLDAKQRRIGIMDAEGNTTTFDYDEEGNLLNITDALNNRISYTYDGRGRLISRTDGRNNTTIHAYNIMDMRIGTTNALGHTMTYRFDANQRLISMTTAGGYTTSYTYDANSNIISLTDANNNTEYRTYDAQNRILSIANPFGDTYSYEYDLLGNLISEVDELSRKTIFTYDARNALISQTNNAGETSIFEYDALGRLVTNRDPRGATQTRIFDVAGRITQVIDAENGATDYTYDAADNIITTSDPLGNDTFYEYDRRNLLVQVTDALDQKQHMTYDALGQQITMSNKRGFTTYYAYDPDGNRTSVTDAINGVTRYEYDEVDNLISITTPLGHGTNYAYDADNRLTSIRLPEGQERTFVYDGVNNLIQEIDEENTTTVYSYDAMNRLITRTNALNFSETYGYDVAGQLVSYVDNLSQETTYQYDLAGRLYQVIEPLDAVTTYNYDLSGNLVSVTDAEGNTRSQSFDLVGRLLQETDANSSSWSYDYDVAGNRIQRTDANGILTNYSFDALNRLIETAYENQTTIDYHYDANDNLISVVDSAGTTVATYDELNRLTSNRTEGREYNETIQYEYDADSRLTRIIYPFTEARYSYNDNAWLTLFETDNGEQISYSYDATGRITQVAYPEANTQFTYDVAGRVTDVRTFALDNGVISARSYLYDANDNVISQVEVTEAFTATRTFIYDARNRLIASAKGNLTTTYNYDNVGNILTETNYVEGDVTKSVIYEYDAMYCLLQQGETVYQCDANGNRVQMQEPQFDGTTLVVDYSYNYEDELVTAEARTILSVELGDEEWLAWSYPQTNIPDETSYESTSTELDQSGSPVSDLTEQEYWTRWTRNITIQEVGTFTFDILYNYGLTFEIDGEQLVYEQETGQSTETISISVELSAGEHQLSLLHGVIEDDDGRLALDITRQPNTDSETYLIEYAYDGLGRLVASTITLTDNTGSHLADMGYIHLGWGWDTLATQTIAIGIDRVQVHYRAGNRMVATDTISSTGSARQYAYFDMLGNVVANSTSGSIETYAYSDYGSLVDGNNTTSDYLWGGHYYESVTGFTNYGSRWFDANSRRWLTRDAYRGEFDMPATQNQYAYVTSNPLSDYDYYGFFMGGLWNKAKEVGNKVVNTVSNVTNKVVNTAKYVGSKIKEGVDTAIQTVRTVVSKGVEIVKSVGSQVINTVKQIGSDLWDAGKNFVQSAYNKATEWVGQARDWIDKFINGEIKYRDLLDKYGDVIGQEKYHEEGEANKLFNKVVSEVDKRAGFVKGVTKTIGDTAQAISKNLPKIDYYDAAMGGVFFKNINKTYEIYPKTAKYLDNVAKYAKPISEWAGAIGNLYDVTEFIYNVGGIINNGRPSNIYDENYDYTRRSVEVVGGFLGGAAGGFLGGAAGGFLGGAAGGVAGATAGPFGAVGGSAIGAVAGAGIGNIGGDYLGSEVGERVGGSIYDIMVSLPQTLGDKKDEIEYEIQHTSDIDYINGFRGMLNMPALSF